MRKDPIKLLRAANPTPRHLQAPPYGRVRARILSGSPEAEQHPVAPARTHRRAGIGLIPSVAAVGSVLVVAVVIAVVLLAGHRSSGPRSTVGAHGPAVTLIYRARPTPQQTEITPTALQRTIVLLKARAQSVGAVSVHAHARGTDEIVLKMSGVSDLSWAESTIGSNAHALFYDWEANLLLPDGKTVASQLPVHTVAAVRYSQGTKHAAPGTADAGGMPLYQAVKLASGQPRTSRHTSLARAGGEYYLFGAPGSAACRAADREIATVPTGGQHCPLAGPETTLKQLQSASLPTGVSFADGHVLEVPQGWVVLQAASPAPLVTAPPLSPTARYFVLRDQPVVSSRQLLTISQARFNGQPTLRTRFTVSGERALHQLTKPIVTRGQTISDPKAVYIQHFAIEVGGQLLATPQANFYVFPFGEPETGSSYIQGPFTARSAATLGAQIPVRTPALRLITARP